MAPNEQEGVANQQESESSKLGTLTAVEQVVNEYAKKFARRYRVSDDDYNVLLVSQFRGIMGLKRGPVVQIVLLWPDAQPSINTLLDSAFRTISRNRLIDTMSIEPVMHIKKRAEERRKWVREKIGDEADIILDLLPKHRIMVEMETKVTYTDVITGEEYSVIHRPQKEYYRGQDVSAWLHLSRIVRDKHPEEAERYVDAIDARTVSGTGGSVELDTVTAGTDVDSCEVDGRQGSSEADREHDGEEHDAARPHQIAG
jgi:hypothetical protein